MVPMLIPNCAGDGISESISMCIPPFGSSEGSLKLDIVTPGSPLNALNEIFLLRDTPLNIVPSASRRSESVKIVHVNSSLCSRYVANTVN